MTAFDSRHNSSSEYFSTVRHDLIPMVPSKSKRILEVGCGHGKTGAMLRKDGVFAAGIEINPSVASLASKVLTEVTVGDIETMAIPYDDDFFDCIICGDILEHLVNPHSAIMKLKKVLAPGGALIASIPNVQCLTVINDLCHGKWPYVDAGILDRTHLRFFTKESIRELFLDAGFEIRIMDEVSIGDGGTSQKDGELRFGNVRISGLNWREMRQFYVFQYLVSAVK